MQEKATNFKRSCKIDSKCKKCVFTVIKKAKKNNTGIKQINEYKMIKKQKYV